MASASDGDFIEVDPAVLENDDSDYASSGYDTSSASLTSSVNEYIFENGRRYHAYFGTDKNLQPTDETEQDRLDLHHEILLKLLKGRYHLAPIRERPQRILDLGTGTGIWAIDMADAYPSAEVLGIDLSPIQPKWVPPNCTFQVDDVEKDWTFRSDFFDFIHVRNVAQAISDWTKMIAETYRCTAPGGYVELAELGGVCHSDDGTMAKNNPLKVQLELQAEATTKIGRPPVTGEVLRDHLHKAGFIDIVVTKHKQPLGPWPREKRLKEIGAMVLLMGETGFHAYGMALFTRILGMSADEADRNCREGFKAQKNKNFHIYNYYYVVYGRKPDNAE